ncbi:MAG: magnesium transporter, partial [Anaerotignum sp.]|nr:magnesium transporter [Anaerotignum sp.]
MIEVYSYDEMEQSGLPLDILEEMRRFGYARFESFEEADCVSLEMLDHENLLLSKGSILLYMEKGRTTCFSAKKEEISSLIREVQEKYTEERMIYGLFAELTISDDASFDAIEQEVMALERALLSEGKRDCVAEIIGLRKRLMVLKKFYEQFLNVLDMLIQNENGIFDGKNIKSFKMLARRTERRFQNVLNLRESVTQVRESYEAEVDISLNQTMKIFTVVTTIFLPLTLIVGWYGMNFAIPEYSWKYGYLVVILLSVVFILS